MTLSAIGKKRITKEEVGWDVYHNGMKPTFATFKTNYIAANKNRILPDFFKQHKAHMYFVDTSGLHPLEEEPTILIPITSMETFISLPTTIQNAETPAEYQDFLTYQVYEDGLQMCTYSAKEDKHVVCSWEKISPYDDFEDGWFAECYWKQGMPKKEGHVIHLANDFIFDYWYNEWVKEGDVYKMD